MLVRLRNEDKLLLDAGAAARGMRPATYASVFCDRICAWLFADTVSGAKASAHLYSLVQTARANELEPYAYLRRLFTELPAAQTVEQIEALLPLKRSG